jgi:hypothetical protein
MRILFTPDLRRAPPAVMVGLGVGRVGETAARAENPEQGGPPAADPAPDSVEVTAGMCAAGLCWREGKARLECGRVTKMPGATPPMSAQGGIQIRTELLPAAGGRGGGQTLKKKQKEAALGVLGCGPRGRRRQTRQRFVVASECRSRPLLSSRDRAKEVGRRRGMREYTQLQHRVVGAPARALCGGPTQATEGLISTGRHNSTPA